MHLPGRCRAFNFGMGGMGWDGWSSSVISLIQGVFLTGPQWTMSLPECPPSGNCLRLNYSPPTNLHRQLPPPTVCTRLGVKGFKLQDLYIKSGQKIFNGFLDHNLSVTS